MRSGRHEGTRTADLRYRANSEEHRMIPRQAIRVGAIAWAAAGAAVALLSFASVNEDARVIVGYATVLGPLAALLASTAVARRQDRRAGLLLVISVAIPTYFAWVLNVSALVVGLGLRAAPTAVIRQRRVVRLA
jgi:hypothetical protein